MFCNSSYRSVAAVGSSQSGSKVLKIVDGSLDTGHCNFVTNRMTRLVVNVE